LGVTESVDIVNEGGREEDYQEQRTATTTNAPAANGPLRF
jgi:hypothetical protein